MITEFGKILRKERIDRGMTMHDMATVLEISPAYLSHMEMGRRPVSSEIIAKLCKILSYHDVKAQKLKRAAEAAYNPSTIKISTKGLREEDSDLLQMFARRFSSLDEEKKKMMFEILDNEQGGEDE